MKAVILAGGLGTRLRPFTDIIPKPLLPLGDKSLMEVQINRLRDCGFNHIFVATNYRAKYVEAFLGTGENHGVKIEFSQEEKPLGTAGPLSLLRDKLDEPFILMNGDILTKLNFEDIYDFNKQKQSTLTIGTKLISTPFRFGNVEVDDNDHVTNIEEKPDHVFEVLAGIYVFQPAALKHIPNDTYFGMDTLLQTLIRENENVTRYLIKDYWLDIGQIDDFQQAREQYTKHFSELRAEE